MPSKFTENVEAQIVGTIIGGVLLLAPAAILAGAAPLLTAVLGEWATYLTELFLGTAALVFTVVAGHYYFFVLPGAKDPAGSPERQRYDALRHDLANGGSAARIYSEKLTAALKAIEHFFRDAGSPGQRIFGLKTPMPLWTAEAFHWCLLLALAYPVAMILLIWTVSGEVGPAEAALGLRSNVPGWLRSILLFGDGLAVLTFWRSQRTRGWKMFMWLALTIAFGSAGPISNGVTTADVAGALLATGGAVGVITGDLSLAALSVAVGAVVGSLALTLAGPLLSTLFGFLAGGLTAIIANAKKISLTRGRTGVFWLVLFLVMIVSCVGAAQFLSPLKSWPVIGPLLLFGGLLTLLNAPFTWFSLGLTRALLWRGLERQQWWPYFYALLDAACAVIVIVLLGCTTVIGIQALNFMAVRGGGSQILPLDELFQGIAANGWAPKYWWLYGLLLSSMVPSLVNLAIGGLSLTRGIPWLSAHLHTLMNSPRSVTDSHRIQTAALIGCQVVVGMALGIAAQATMVLILLRDAMPSLGVGLLEIARAVAALGLPGRIFGLF